MDIVLASIITMNKFKTPCSHSTFFIENQKVVAITMKVRHSLVRIITLSRSIHKIAINIFLVFQHFAFVHSSYLSKQYRFEE